MNLAATDRPIPNLRFGHIFCQRLVGCSLIILMLLSFVGLAYAQDDEDAVHITPRVMPAAPSAPSIDPALNTHTRPLTSNVNMVLVPVTVTDPDNRIVTGLEKRNFAVYQDKEQQRIQNLSSDDAPLSLGIILDLSGSMADKLENARQAIVEFLKTANPQDEFFLIGFSDRPELLSGFTHSIGDVQNKLVLTQAKGLTSLLDAIYLAIHQMTHAENRRKALLIISDGGDNHSRYTEREVTSLVEEADVQIYAIGLYDAAPPTEEERFGPELLAKVTEATGGRVFTIQNPNELADVATNISMQLRDEYILGYLPNKLLKDGKWHKIKVKLLPPKGLPPLHVYAKKGYYAPPQ